TRRSSDLLCLISLLVCQVSGRAMRGRPTAAECAVDIAASDRCAGSDSDIHPPQGARGRELIRQAVGADLDGRSACEETERLRIDKKPCRRHATDCPRERAPSLRRDLPRHRKPFLDLEVSMAVQTAR